ncbi:MAG: DNA repair protein RecN [Candidatus Dactylopiibacterium carminicum]|uniref:DNA repair protein RecN n=1 Tax=Candidatus Dactylopiibacterium carminicum TaxID=857335 RepID=A0A272EU66_9RHOO|nr:DNA repair protein RecN [Candidatus Dactylopiibacterium carminicum]KAF7599702.1 DNA repair protein RecN [Candidatus Dactylopiibacterium carminicum]PAS93638.1 MAG: DNA repair protein RecN [Candidatus Dactylopiibacterium carminicum]PAS97505.1 MAG: DNA repair protein RecN [Candidatus Dactylopiibacterium carminicum]
MLRRLLIQDFVLVDRLELDFRPGFGALTGETGAGKSILLDALSLLLGERADGGMVRTGRERADLSAEFDPCAEAQAWLRANDLAVEDDGVLLRRVVDAGGRSRAYINGTPATATQLRELGDYLADIHGQHAHQALLRNDAQRELLDAHAGLTPLAREVSDLWRALQTARRARQEAMAGMEALLRERELLSHQAEELGRLNFEPTAWDAVNQEHTRLANAAGLIEGATTALEAISERDAPLSSETERLAARLSELAAHDPALNEVSELLSEAAIRLEEAGHALRRYQDRLELDPARLREVEQRIEEVIGCARKYRVGPEELPTLLTQANTRLAQLTDLADPEALAAREDAAKQAFLKRAEVLSQQRASAAAKLGEAVTEAMQDLAMSGGRFEVALLVEPEGAGFGLERVEFQVAANPSQPLRPLAKVASGGELSRIGLSIQVITSEAQAVPTLIFDEVDTGIGGRVAEIVGRRLRELGTKRQVLCVTHLPQVAAQANWQWRVSKEQRDGQTLSSLLTLDETGRIEEIARMLGGVNITETTRNHAAELLGLEVRHTARICNRNAQRRSGRHRRLGGY